MQRIRSVGSVPERMVMSALQRKQIYFAPNVITLPGKPDIVFRRKHIAVFIDSDFWHGNIRRFRMPATNRKYWTIKIRRNKERDKEVNRQLKKQGWKVYRFWEYDVKHRFDKVFARLLSELENAEAS